jgi:hypothetical protein
MALSINITSEGKSSVQTPLGVVQTGVQQVTFTAYVKVDSIIGNKNEVQAKVSFSGENQHFTKTYQVPVTVEHGAPNFIKQVYVHLKTLSEFENAVDC